MKHIKIKIYSLLAASIFFGGCEKALDPKTDSNYGDEFVWSLPNKAEGVLINAYANIPARFDSYSDNNFLDAATDDAVSNNYNSGIFNLGAGGLSTTQNPVGTWFNNYTQLRNINLFLENGLTDKVTYDLTSEANDKLVKDRLKGEALFLRAYWSFILLQQYGGKTNDGQALGYPILLKTLTDEEAKNTNIVRNTYEECVLQILADLDAAQLLLPVEYAGSDNIVGINGFGRANKKTCVALKSRVSVYGASPAFQPNSIAQITGMGQFTVTDQAQYLQKWERAAKYAAEAIPIVGVYRSLKVTDFNATPVPDDFLFRRFSNNNLTERAQYPRSNFGNATTGPSQNLVEAFPALNGYPITDSRSNFDPNNPYANRDPRLDLTVYRNGSTFDGRKIEVFAEGLDSQNSFANATRTGYYLRKWLSSKTGLLNPETIQTDFNYYVMLRKAEVYLNYAEAANEAYGPNGIAPGATLSAADVIKNVRREAGLTNTSSVAYVNEVAALGKNEFRKLIQNEIRLTFAFENTRFFNMRRWVLPLNEPVTGVKVTKINSTTFQYQKNEVEKRRFNDIKYYYMPLPYDEISKSPSLINNMGW